MRVFFVLLRTKRSYHNIIVLFIIIIFELRIKNCAYYKLGVNNVDLIYKLKYYKPSKQINTILVSKL